MLWMSKSLVTIQVSCHIYAVSCTTENYSFLYTRPYRCERLTVTRVLKAKLCSNTCHYFKMRPNFRYHPWCIPLLDSVECIMLPCPYGTLSSNPLPNSIDNLEGSMTFVTVIGLPLYMVFDNVDSSHWTHPHKKFSMIPQIWLCAKQKSAEHTY